jgi:hypothetical protein
MSEENKYRQLAMFTTIVAEVVISPALLGGLAYYLFRNSALLGVFVPLAALLGLAIAFYRISQLRKRFEKNES